jgi:hypothetical protein
MQEVGRWRRTPKELSSILHEGKGKRQTEQAMGSVPQSHEPEVAQATVHEGVPEVGASSPQAK